MTAILVEKLLKSIVVLKRLGIMHLVRIKLKKKLG